MNNYSTNVDREKPVICLIFASIVIAFLFNEHVYPIAESIWYSLFSKEGDFNTLLGFLDISLAALTSMGVYKILWYLYDEHFWKFKKFGCKLINKMPDLSGEWRGTCSSSYKQKKGEETQLQMKMIINQSYSKIKAVCSFYKDDLDENTSTSRSVLIGVFEEGNDAVLRFSFQNNSNEVSTKSKLYLGYNEFSVNLKEMTMEGQYFNGRDSGQNHGVMKLKKMTEES